MFKTKKSRRNAIVTIISIAACIILFFITKICVRGSLATPSGGELFFFLIPLIVCLFINNWKLFMKTFFPKDTWFEDYFNEYFTGKDMMEADKSLGAADIDYYITR